jgi:hypothetical protein
MATPNLQPVQSPRRLGRSILAVVAGIFTGALLSIGTDLLMVAMGLIPPLGQTGVTSGALVVATIYRTLYGILGSYLTARLAPRSPMAHAMALGILGFFVSVAGAAATWNRQPSLGPHWYPVALVVLALPTAWLGGKLRLMQK